MTIGALKNITAPKQLESILEVSNNPAHQQRSLKFEATFMQVMLGRELLGWNAVWDSKGYLDPLIGGEEISVYGYLSVFLSNFSGIKLVPPCYETMSSEECIKAHR